MKVQGQVIRDIDTTLGQQFRDIAERQRKPGVEPNRMLDDHGRKAMSLERYRGHAATIATPAGGAGGA